MSDLIRKAKDRGSQLLTQGKLKPALEQFQMVIAKAPQEVTSRQKIAEILVRLDRKKDAVEEYTRVSDAYAHAGQFYKAIAICKIILSLDPKHQAAQDTVTKLYSSIREPTPRKMMAPATGMHAAAFRAPPAEVAPPPAPKAPEPEAIVEEEILIEVELEAPPPPPQDEPGVSLPSIPLFSELTPDEFKAVLSGAVEARAFFEGETIVTEGEMGHAMYAIVQGEVAVKRTLAGQPAREVARMKEGDIFGEIALVSGGPRLATVVASGEVITLEFQREAMATLMNKYPNLRTALDRFFRDRLLANLLRASPVFRLLPPELNEQLSKQFTAQTFAPGESIVAQGSEGRGVFMILRGSCEAFDAKTGTKYPNLHEGDYFGEISVMLKRPATATVRAASAVTVLKLDAETFLNPIMKLPKVSQAVVALARERFARSEAVAVSDDNQFDLLV